jgi:fructose-specific component phosphotransferase system IIB-like protein
MMEERHRFDVIDHEQLAAQLIAVIGRAFPASILRGKTIYLEIGR